jgi:glycosyltransferase involved in cell wall biosynthesis
MRMSADAGHSWAAALGERELASVIARERRVYDGATAIFTFSEFVRQSFVNQVGVPADKVVAGYVGPNLDLTSIRPRAARRPDAPPTILFVGKEFERKGGDVLLAAFRRVRTHLADARLTIIGPPDLTVDDPGVTSLGFLRKDDPESLRVLTDAYANADVFCLPTRYEPFGIVILEAMFHGLPCIATHDWSIPEMIRDGETGYTVPVGDEVTLADRLTSLLSDPTRARAMGDAGLAHARERFTWPNVAERITREMQRRLSVTSAERNAARHAPVGAGGRG